MNTAILAAGKATRHPNKILLPGRDRRPIIERLMNSLPNAEIVVTPDSILKEVYPNRRFVDQSEGDVLDAIQLLSTPVAVYCGDNWFEEMPSLDHCTRNTIHVAHQPVYEDLIRWPSFTRSKEALAVCGPFVVYDSDFVTLKDFFRSCDVRFWSATGWYDLGTPESYRRYWEDYNAGLH